MPSEKLMLHHKDEDLYKDISELDVEKLADAKADLLCIYTIRALKNAITDPTKEWQLSVRASNVLERNNIRTVRRLEELTKREIVQLPRCGMKVIDDVCQEATRQGVELPNWSRALVGKYQVTIYSGTSKENVERVMKESENDPQ